MLVMPLMEDEKLTRCEDINYDMAKKWTKYNNRNMVKKTRYEYSGVGT